MTELRDFWNEEDGMGTVEMVLIIAALVAIALLFRRAIVDFIQGALASVFGDKTKEAYDPTKV